MLHRLYQKAWSELEAHYQSYVNLPTQIETLVKWNLRVIPLVLCSQNGSKISSPGKNFRRLYWFVALPATTIQLISFVEESKVL
jgi:hypothetical protein